MIKRRKSVRVQVGNIGIGGNEPIRIQSMTNTSTENAKATANQILKLAQAGSELVRVTVNSREAAANILEIKRRVRDAGCDVPLIGDFHYNGHILLTQFPDMAKSLDKYRINPGNVRSGKNPNAPFSIICRVAQDFAKPVRIGVNSGSLDPDLVDEKMKKNTEKNFEKATESILDECMIASALNSTEQAMKNGLKKDQIIISCKTSRPESLVGIYQKLAEETDLAFHLGLTEAGIGYQGVIASSVAMGILLQKGIGDTIRVSLTPKPHESRTEEVLAAQHILQSLEIRKFFPKVTACPGCGRTTSAVFQELASEIDLFVREKNAEWKSKFKGVENLNIAVMGCIVNGPGESKHADIGISLPGIAEEPSSPVYIDGKKTLTLKGGKKHIAKEFKRIIEGYVKEKGDRG